MPSIVIDLLSLKVVYPTFARERAMDEEKSVELISHLIGVELFIIQSVIKRIFAASVVYSY
jgi:hypothetical protein